MITGRPKQPLNLSDEDRLQFESISSLRNMPLGLVIRAQIVLMVARGESNSAIAQKLDLSKHAVGVWHQRYINHGLQGLQLDLRVGRIRPISDELVTQLVHKTLGAKSKRRHAMERTNDSENNPTFLTKTQ